jgi:hypothetical protein
MVGSLKLFELLDLEVAADLLCEVIVDFAVAWNC